MTATLAFVTKMTGLRNGALKFSVAPGDDERKNVQGDLIGYFIENDFNIRVLKDKIFFFERRMSGDGLANRC